MEGSFFSPSQGPLLRTLKGPHFPADGTQANQVNAPWASHCLQDPLPCAELQVPSAAFNGFCLDLVILVRPEDWVMGVATGVVLHNMG